MSSIKVVSLLADAQVLLSDTSGTRWPLLELQAWLNAGYRELVNVRPDANVLVGTFNCALGARQDIASQFTNASRLLEVVRNMAATSNKSAIILVDRHSLDDQRSNWTTDPASISIDNYVYDPRVITQFLVYPPAASGAQVEVIYYAVPDPHALTLSQLQNTSTAETIRVADIYANCLLDYMLFRAFSKDSDNPAMASRAAAHYQAFGAFLTAKTTVDGATKPGAA